MHLFLAAVLNVFSEYNTFFNIVIIVELAMLIWLANEQDKRNKK